MRICESRAQVDYNPALVYHASEVLLYPTPAAQLTPAQDALLMAREALSVETLPKVRRDVVVYCTRQGEGVLEVDNEEELLVCSQPRILT